MACEDMNIGLTNHLHHLNDSLFTLTVIILSNIITLTQIFDTDHHQDVDVT